MGMMYFQVEEDKVEKISQHLEKGLRYIGKAMQCVDEMTQGGAMGERMGYRDEYRDDDEMNYRHGRSRMGYRSPQYREPYMM